MKLHPYQIAAVEYLRAHPFAALWLDMGLGKTASVLAALPPDAFPVLVAAPPRVAREVWPDEAEIWRPDLRIQLIDGPPKQRAKQWAAEADIYAVSREILAEAVKAGPEWRTLVLDESSGFRTRGTKRWRAARALVNLPSITRVWQMTGTPSPNGLLNVWAQIYLLDRGERLGRTLGGYRERYFSPTGRLPSGVITGWAIRPGAEDRIHKLLEDIVLAMEGRVDIPPSSLNVVKATLPPAAAKAYKEMKRTMVADLSILGGVTHSATTAATVSNKLSQIAAGFIYDDDGAGVDRIHSAKIDALREIVEGTDSPVLVFYRYREEAAMIQEAFPEAVSVQESDSVKRWNQGEIPLLYAHPASAGHGLNLQHGGHTIVWTSLPWSLELWQQANKRLARQGQKHPVVIHTIEARGTLDPAIHRVLDQKASVQAALTSHLESLL